MLLNGFVKIDARISLSCYMDVLKLLYGFVKVVTWICQRCYMDLLNLFYVFLTHCQKKNQAEV